VEAWHIIEEHLRNGKPIPPDGERLVHEGELVLHKSGYHAHKRVVDALKYARGDSAICRVEVDGKIIEDLDILVAEKRKILWRVDSEPVLGAFARWCALQVADLWDAPELVIEYLATGAEKYREATRLVTHHSYWDLPLKNPFIENSHLYLTASHKLIEVLAATVTLWATGEYCSACENAKLAARDSATCLAAVSTYKANTLIDTIIAQNEQLEHMVYEARNGKKQWTFEYQIKE